MLGMLRTGGVAEVVEDVSRRSLFGGSAARARRACGSVKRKRCARCVARVEDASGEKAVALGGGWAGEVVRVGKRGGEGGGEVGRDRVRPA
eukprot:5629773-Pleurochrysis_carterae.AAC.1